MQWVEWYKSCTLNDTFYAPVGIIKEFLDQMNSANVLNCFRKGQLISNVSLLLLIHRDLMHKVKNALLILENLVLLWF